MCAFNNPHNNIVKDSDPLNERITRMRRHRDEFEVVGAPRARGDKRDPSRDWEELASQYMEFTDTNPTEYHVVDSLRSQLEGNGFKFLDERESWDEALQEGNRFVVTRNGAALVALVRGKDWKSANGAAIVGTHLDSLHLKLRPTSKRSNAEGFELLGVAPYADVLHKEFWWDRDLGVGGRVIVRDGKKITTKLVRIPYPIARIPSLAPHFGSPAEGPFNPETQAVPIIGIVPKDPRDLEPSEDEKRSPIINQHPLRLLRGIAKHADVALGDIIGVELELFDTQPASFGGIDKEFLFAPRIDDRICTFAAVNGLIEAADEVESGSSLAIVAAYDYEEVGSLSRTGAHGNFLESVVQRLLHDAAEHVLRVFYANSFLVSADVLHAVNPNFSEAYLDGHKPLLNVGPTIGFDSNGHFCTTGIDAAFLQELARRSGDTLQQFQIRNGTRSGGTIGPTLTSKTDVRGVDLGIPQWSMHSIRAATGSKDVYLGVRFFKSYYELREQVDLEFKLGNL